MKINKAICYISRLLSIFLWVWTFPDSFSCFSEGFIKIGNFVNCIFSSNTPVLLWVCGLLIAWLVRRGPSPKLHKISFLALCMWIVLVVVTFSLPLVEDFIRKFRVGYEIFRGYGLLIYALSWTLLFVGVGFLLGVSSGKEGGIRTSTKHS